MPEIGLAEVVRGLRAELENAMTLAAGERIQFEATSIEMEFQVGVTRSADAKGGLKFWVFELGAGGSQASETVQKVAVSLKPVLTGGGAVRITQGTDEMPLGETRRP